MSWKRFLLCCVLSIPLALGLYVLADLAVAAKAEGQKGKPSPQRAATAVQPIRVATCYDCHSEIQEFHAKGKHAKVNCASCHDGLDKHLQDPSRMLKNPFSPRLLKKVQMQGGARCEVRGVLGPYAAAPRKRANAADGPFSAAC